MEMNTNTRLKRLTNFKKNVIVHFTFLFLLLIWVFSISLMPVNYQENGQLTVMYYRNQTLNLTPLGIITSIISILFVIHIVFLITITIKQKQTFFFFKNLDNKKKNWYFLSAWILAIAILVMMFGFIFATPNTNEFTEKLFFKQFITSLDSANITQQQHDIFIGYVNKYGWAEQLKAIGLANYNDFIGTNVSLNSNIISFLQNVFIDFTPSYFVPLFKVSSESAVVNPVFYFNIVIFSLMLFYLLSSAFGLHMSNNRILISKKSFKERRESFKLLTNELKEKLKTKKENKEKRKLLLKEEEQLLVGLDNFESEKEIETISQEELQEKINKNNELKNRIMEIHAQQKKLKDESKLFKSKNQKEEINKRSTKIKKHEITIPDDELEEIFKNLDI